MAHVHRWLLGKVGRSSGRPSDGSATSVVRYSCACGARKCVRVRSTLVRATVEYREAQRAMVRS